VERCEYGWSSMGEYEVEEGVEVADGELEGGVNGESIDGKVEPTASGAGGSKEC
jgi:hypothetical protein